MITSTANPRLKDIRKLRDRKERQRTQLFFAEGIRILTEAAELGAYIETLIISPELLNNEFGAAQVEKLAHRGIPVLEVSKSVFEWLACKENPQGIAAVIRQHWQLLTDVKMQLSGLWVALDSIADPGNLGTILRTLDGVGGLGVILLDHCTDPYDPAAVRASMGALFAIGLVKASLVEFGKWKHENGALVIGTSGRAKIDYREFRYPEHMVLLMGSERQGLSPAHIELCDGLVSIPMTGRSDSLNLAVATSVVLYEIFYQRRTLDTGIISGGKT
jgi:RNA methyltransferase, TrmH family